MKNPYIASTSVFLHSCAHVSARPQDSWSGLCFSLNVMSVFITREQSSRAVIFHLLARLEDTSLAANWTYFMDPLGRTGAGNRGVWSKSLQAAFLDLEIKAGGVGMPSPSPWAQGIGVVSTIIYWIRPGGLRIFPSFSWVSHGVCLGK